MITLYGIRNCDTVRKARRWLDEHEIDYRFHDFRGDGLPAALLDEWIGELGWEALLNRRGTSWRKLPENVRASLDRRGARKLMLEQPSIIKRPVLDIAGARHIGFKPDTYRHLLNATATQ